MYRKHKNLVELQGRKLSWIAKQLDCSYSLVYKYLNGQCSMADDRIEKLDEILSVAQK